MKDVKAIVNTYPCDGDMVQKPNIIFFNLAKRGRQTELRLGLLKIPVGLNESYRGEKFQMCASANMAIYALKMTKLEVSSNLEMLQPVSS